MEFSPPLVPNMNLITKDEITSPLSAQILEFSESELFPETLQNNSEVGSTSNCGGAYDDHSSYSTTNLPLTPDMSAAFNPTTTKDNITTAADDDDPNHLSIIFDPDLDFGPACNGTSAAENFCLPPPQFLLNPQFDIHHQQQQYQAAAEQQMAQLLPPPQIMFEEECLSSVPSYLRLASSSSSPSQSCSLLDPGGLGSFLPGNLNPAALSGDNSGVFAASGFFLGAELPPHQELEFQGDNSNSRVFCPDNIPRVYSDQFQTLGSETQHLVSGGGSSTAALTSDLTCLEDPTYNNKPGKITVEERKEKIHRYLKKRNERNFSKKIKYACRKTLADSRPRVRGRFAKNDDFGDVTTRPSSMGTHEDDTHVVVDEAARHNNFIYDPNYNSAIASLSHGGRIFNSNCLGAAPSGPGPYDMCTSLFCADANMHG